MTCASIHPLIEPFLDDELDPNQQAIVRAHLEACPSCDAEYRALSRLRGAIREQSLYFRAPDSLRHRVANALRESEPAPRAQRASPWQWLAIAASIALAISLGANLVLTRSYRSESQLIAREALSGHVRAMLGSHLIDVVSSDRHTVKPWFADKLDFSPSVKDLAAQGFPLAGARVDYLDGRPVAALVFHRAKHVIDLFTWPSSALENQALTRNGLSLVAWTRDGMTYWAVSDLNLPELRQFAALYRD